MAYYLFKNGQIEYKTAGIQYLSDALKENISIRWLSGLSEKLFSSKCKMIDKNDFFEKKNRSSAPEWKTQKNSDNLYPIYFKKIDKK